MKRARSSSTGYTLLEQALVLPIALVVVFAAVDAHNLFRAYSALRQGVKDALRCAYPVNGACVAAQQDTRGRLFDVFLHDSSEEHVFVPKFDYDGRYEFLSLPTIEYRDPRATVLHSVSFDAQRHHLSVVRPMFEAQGVYRYRVERAQRPYLAGTDRRNPQIVYPLSRSVAYPNTPLHDTRVNGSPGSFSQVDLRLAAGQSGSTTTTFSFVVRRPVDLEMACRLSLRHGAANGVHEPTSTPCDLTRTKVLLHVLGTQSADAWSAGNVTMEFGPVGELRALGGQVFGNESGISRTSGQANFVPRGADPDGFVASELLLPPGQPDELRLHTNLEVEYERRYQLRLTLHRASAFPSGRPTESGALNWRATGLRLYTAQYGSPETLIAPCENTFYDSQRAMPELCQSTHPIVQRAALAASGLQQVVHVGDEPYQVVTRYSLPANFEDLSFLDQSQLPGPLQDFRVALPVQSEVVREQQSCPAIGTSLGDGYLPNFGVATLDDQAQAAAICPPSNEQMREEGAQALPGSAQWSEHELAVPTAPTVVVEAKDCDDLMPSALPDPLLHYPRLRFASHDIIGSHSRQFTNRAPVQEFLSANPRFACDAVRPGFVELNEQNEELPHDSLFRGSHFDLGCNTEETLRQAATTHGMDPAAYFTYDASRQGEGRYEGIPADQCTEYRLGREFTGERRYLGRFNEGTLPPECHADGHRCEVQLAGFSAGSSGASSIDLAAAVEFGTRTVQGTYPRAVPGCQGEECFSLNIEELDDEAALRAEGTIEVPMKLLLGRSIALSFTEQERKELYYVER